jgi:HK97 family phage portal protein
VYLSSGRTISIAPQAFAETSPNFQQAYFVPHIGLGLEAKFASYAKLYIEQIWVYAVIRKISTLIARLGTNVWDYVDAGTDSSAEAGKKIDLTSPYARLMANPCPYLDPFSFWLWVCSTKEIYGEAFGLKMRDAKGKPEAILPMHPSQTQIERDNSGELLYRFMGQPNALIPENDVVVWADYHPDNTMRGLSTLEPLRNTLMVEDSSRRAVNSWFDKAGRPSMVLQTDKRLGKEGRRRLKNAYEEAHRGSDNAGGTLVLEDAVKAVQMQMDAKSLEYTNVRQLAQTEVCGAYDVPPSAVHILKDATYTNVTEQLRSIYRDSASWRIASLQSSCDFYIGREFNSDKRLEFNVAEVMRGDLEVRAPAAATLVNASIAQPAEVRPWFGLGDAGPSSRKLLSNGTMKPLDDVVNPPEPPAQPALPAGGHELPGQSQQPHTPDGLPAPVTAMRPGNTKPAVTPGQGNGGRLRRASLSEQAQQYSRLIGGAIGRGKSLREAAAPLWEEIKAAGGGQPDPELGEALAEAVAHIIERKQAA